MDELGITILSLVGGAVLASLSGIVVTWWTNTRNEKKELEGFKLEFKLAIEKLCKRLAEFDDIYNSMDVERANEYISTPFVKDPIFRKYSEIAKLSQINIELYYDIIKALEDIDRCVGRTNPVTLFRGDNTIKDICIGNPIWNKLNEFMKVYSRDLREFMWSLS